ncbi:High frequency lysogenization protein HflD [Citrobacter koseri]|nr:High frequency lysogenization protein HflD [Citrobacter koseri]
MTSPSHWQAFCQSARLVQQLAHQGHCDADALHVSLNSVIDMNPSSTLGVFGGSEANLRLGLETLLGVLNASSRQGLNAELTRYTLSLMVLERKLSAAKGALDMLGERINGLQRQLDHFDLQSETLDERDGRYLCRCHQPAGAAHSGDGLTRRAAKPAGAGKSSRLASGRYPCRSALAPGRRWPPAINVFS